MAPWIINDQMIMRIKETLTWLALALTLACYLMAPVGCYYDVEEDLYPTTGCDTVDVSYSAVVLPLLEIACYGCHDDANNLGGISIEGYDKLKPFADNGALVGVIRHQDGYSPMPQNQGPLPECDIQKIEAWIADGAQNN